MQRYVPVERRFSEYQPQDEDTGGWTPVFGSSLYSPYTWKDVLGHRCTVVIAPSGTGKTEEFKQQAERLREQGRATFFCRLEDLASLPVVNSLEIGEKVELEAWLASADDGWFFLDSVDEAKLVNLHHFRRAIDTFIDAIAPHRTRIHAVISSRPHAWGAYDAEMLCARLDLSLNDKADDEGAEDEESEDAVGIDSVLDEAAQSKKNPKRRRERLHILRLAPLGWSEIRVFAKACGVTDVDAFMEDVEGSNADALASRPEELQGLIDDWRAHKRIGSYHSVVLGNVTRRLKETNPRHQQVALLTAERAMVGAERLAAGGGARQSG
ncbi:MAG TPA: hypothetical protein VH913_13315 [Hyphomicrobiaceae bacterium]|jgi:hypothetical protein